MTAMRSEWRRWSAAAAVLMCVTGAAMAARAGGAAPDPQLVAEGRAIAQQRCARCHAIAGPGPSPVREAPVFSGFSRRFLIPDIAEALAEGIVTGHGPVIMPEFVFQPREIDALIAYIESVQRP